MSLTTLAALAIAGLVLYAVIGGVIAALKQSGANAARAKRAEADLAVAKKQGAIMAEQRSVEDVKDSLRRHDF